MRLVLVLCSSQLLIRKSVFKLGSMFQRVMFRGTLLNLKLTLRLIYHQVFVQLISKVLTINTFWLFLIRIQNILGLALDAVIVNGRLHWIIKSCSWSQLLILRMFKRGTLTRRIRNSSPGGSWSAQSLFVRILLFWLFLYNFTFCVYLPIGLLWLANCSLNIKSRSIFS